MGPSVIALDQEQFDTLIAAIEAVTAKIAELLAELESQAP